jgi:hypothetical protein
LPLWFSLTFALCLVCPMLPVSPDCSFLIAPSIFSNIYFHRGSQRCINSIYKARI